MPKKSLNWCSKISKKYLRKVQRKIQNSLEMFKSELEMFWGFPK